MDTTDRLEQLIAALDRAQLSDQERQSFLGYLAFAAAATTGGPQPKPILALIGTVASAAGVKELDTPETARRKLDAHFAANPPPPRAMAAFRAWQAAQAPPPKPLSHDDLARLMIATPTQNMGQRSAPAPEGSVPSGPLARFDLDKN